MRKKIIVICSVSVVFLIIIGGFFGFQSFQKQQEIQKLIEEITAHYSLYVTVEKGSLYCKKQMGYEVCGTISNPITIPLEDVKIGKNSQYFQIKNTNYYLFYKDTKVAESLKDKHTNYIVFNQNIKTLETTNLFQNGNPVLSISQAMEFPIVYQDTDYYYINYLEQIFAISKIDSIEVLAHQNTEEVSATKIPVLYYENMESWKEQENWKEQLALLKDGGFYSISLSEYEAWFQGNLRLKEHAILLLAQQDRIIEDYQFYNPANSSISFLSASAVSEPQKAYQYQVNMTISKEQFADMLLGNPVITSNKDQKVAVLNYHFFYNPDIGEACNENICLATSKFEEQLQYLKNNGYYTLTIGEFRDWMYGKIDIPEKSVLLTIDDGAAGTGKHNGHKLIPLLEKYDLHATLFLITGWWDIANYSSPNLDVESHTNDMHTMYESGAQLLISSHEQVINDLKQSIEVTKSKIAFCFPFYAYNETAINQVKQVGFELSFVGGNYKASRNSDKTWTFRE